MKTNRTRPCDPLTSPPCRALLTLLSLSLCLAPIAVRAVTNIWTAASGSDLNWSTAGNWTPGLPATTDDVLFDTNAVVFDTTIDNTVDANTTVASLSYTHTNASTSYHNTAINDGLTLIVSNSASSPAIFVGAGADTLGINTMATLSGQNASLVVAAPNGVLNVRQGGQSHFSGTASLDLSSLSNTTITVNRLLVAGDGSNAGSDMNRPADRPTGSLKLAQNSTVNILAASAANPPGLTVGYTIGNVAQPTSDFTLNLTNLINSDSGIGIGLVRVPGRMTFNPSLVGSPTPPYARFRNLAGSGRQSKWLIGDDSLAADWSGTTSGTVDLTGVNGLLDAQVDQLVVGRSVNAANTPHDNYALGTLSFDGGVLDANTVVIGYQMQDYCSRVQGTLNISGTAQLIVNSSIQLGRFLAADEGTNGHSSAVLNIYGGSVSVAGSITTAASPLNPSNDSQLNVYGGSLYVKGSVGPLSQLILGSGSTNILDLGTSVNPLTPICTVTNLQTAAPVYLAIQGSALDIGTIQVIKYASYGPLDISDFVATMPANVFGYFTNNTSTLSIDLVITNTAVFSWNGAPNGDWDVEGTMNWKSGLAPVVYDTGHNAQFDDSATGTTTVNIVSNIPPPTTLFKNSTKSYTLAGAGAITGSGGLTKSGSGTVTIANTGGNSFSGAVAINAGTLKLDLGADRLPTNAAVTLANAAGATLDLNGQDQSLASIAGAGTSGGEVKIGSGTLTIRGTTTTTYAGLLSGSGRLLRTNSGILYLSRPAGNTYAGGTVISNGTLYVQNSTGNGLGSGSTLIAGTGALYLGNNSANGSVAGTITAYTAANGGSAGLYVNRSDNLTLDNLYAGTGQLYKLQANTLTLATSNSFSGMCNINGGALRVAHPNALGTPASSGKNWDTIVAGGSTITARLELSNNVTLLERILIASKGGAYPYNPSIVSLSGTNTLGGLVTWTSGGTYWYLKSEAGSKLIVSNLVNYSSMSAANIYWQLGGAGDGDLYGALGNGVANSTNNVLKDGPGTWTLWATNSYIGATTISNGTLVVNGVIPGSGRLGNGPAGNVYMDCNIYGAATLRGSGRIMSAVTNFGTLAPGSSSAIGTLAVSNYLTLSANSTNLFRVSQTGIPTADQVVGVTTLTYGGKLKVSLTGTLVGGEVFHLFSAASYAGSFASIELPAIPAPLSWDSSQLPVDGTLRVNGTVSNKSIDIAHYAGGGSANFQLTGSSTLTNWNYRVMATTNVADPLSWIQVGSGSFTAGAFNFVDLDSTNWPQRFYRVVAP